MTYEELMSNGGPKKDRLLKCTQRGQYCQNLPIFKADPDSISVLVCFKCKYLYYYFEWRINKTIFKNEKFDNEKGESFSAIPFFGLILWFCFVFIKFLISLNAYLNSNDMFCYWLEEEKVLVDGHEMYLKHLNNV